MINFVSGGHTGDLIHELYIIKNICNKQNTRANLYITDSSSKINQCVDFSFNLNKIYNDTKELIESQYYINHYGILPPQYNEHTVNLSHWRNAKPFRNWTDLLCSYYKIRPSKEYRWLISTSLDSNTNKKVLIHHSGRRINYNFNWNILSDIDKDVFFITSEIREYEIFKTRKLTRNIPLYLVSTVSEMATAISSCDLFIGNQSMPFTLACGFDKLRICELHGPSAEFYIHENVYSDNISWYLDNNMKYNSPNIKLKV